MVNGINTQSLYGTTPITEGSSTPAVQNNTATSAAPGATAEDELQELALDETEKTEEEEALDKVNNELEKAEKQYADKINNCYKQIEQLYKQLDELDTQRRTMLQQLFAGGDSSSIASGMSQISQQKQSVMNNITSILLNIASLENALEEGRISAQESIDKINDLINQKQTTQNIQTALGNSLAEITPDMGMGDIIAAIGNSFVGVINNDEQGNAAFSNGVSQHWCADFVTSIVKMACETTGEAVPSGFGSSSVSGLMEWSKSNNTFLQTAGRSDKAAIIANNVKPGDVLIQKENGKSHTGIVTKVYPDGSFDTVEGNSSDAVKNRHYSADSDVLTGFIKMTN